MLTTHEKARVTQEARAVKKELRHTHEASKAIVGALYVARDQYKLDAAVPQPERTREAFERQQAIVELLIDVLE